MPGRTPPVAAGLPDNVILVGRFGAPHGVRGEIRLQSFTADPLAIAGYAGLLDAAGRPVTLTAARLIRDNLLVVRVAAVGDRDAAARLTNGEIFLPRDALPAPDDDEFYLADLIGMTAVDEAGAALGTIVDVPNYGGGDLIELRPAGGGDSVLYPFTRAVVPTVDLAARRLTLIPPDMVDDPDIPGSRSGNPEPGRA